MSSGIWCCMNQREKKIMKIPVRRTCSKSTQEMGRVFNNGLLLIIMVKLLDDSKLWPEGVGLEPGYNTGCPASKKGLILQMS